MALILPKTSNFLKKSMRDAHDRNSDAIPTLHCLAGTHVHSLLNWAEVKTIVRM